MDVTPEDRKIIDLIIAELHDPKSVGEHREELQEALEYYQHKYCFDWLLEDEEETAP